MNQRKKRKMPEAYLEVEEPPNSPPMMNLLATRTMKHTMATAKKTAIEKVRAPDFTT